MSNKQLQEHLVSRFLSWKLPEDFQPDAGISFKAEYNEHTEHPGRHEPVGTNLLNFTQATEMVQYMLEGALLSELEAEVIESHNQLMLLVHDELDGCKTVDQLREYIRNTVIPLVYPAPQVEKQHV